MAQIGEQIDAPESRKIVLPSTGDLTPEWRDVVDDLIELINLLSTKVDELEDRLEVLE